jgi:hypothetical protein
MWKEIRNLSQSRFKLCYCLHMIQLQNSEVARQCSDLRSKYGWITAGDDYFNRNVFQMGEIADEARPNPRILGKKLKLEVTDSCPNRKR